jgi:uncharacterized membrane protein
MELGGKCGIFVVYVFDSDVIVLIAKDIRRIRHFEESEI